MTSDSLIGKIVDLLGIEPMSIEEDENRSFHVTAWFASPTGLLLFGVTIISGNGIDWRVGGAIDMPGKTMRQLSQLHEVTCGEAAKESADVSAD